MPQVNILPISVPQSVEVLDESAALSGNKSNDDFSQLIDRHLAHGHESKGTEGSKKRNDNESIKAMETEPGSTDKNARTDNEQTSSRNSDVKEAPQNKEREVAASGNNDHSPSSDTQQDKSELSSEQLMEFLYKADNTLQKNSAEHAEQNAPINGSLSAEQKALYEAQLLLNGSNLVADLSQVAKALSAEQLEQELSKNQNDINSLHGNVTQSQLDDGVAKLPVEPVISVSQSVPKNTEVANESLVDDAVDILQLQQRKTSLAASNLSEANRIQASLVHTKNDQSETTKGESSVKADISHIEHANKIEAMSPEGENIEELELVSSPLASNGKTSSSAMSEFERAKSTLNQKIIELAQAKQVAKTSNDVSTLSKENNSTNKSGDVSDLQNLNAINTDNEFSDELMINIDKQLPDGAKAIGSGFISNPMLAEQVVEQSSNKKVVEQKVNIPTPLNQIAPESEQKLSKEQGKQIEQAIAQEQFFAKAQKESEDIELAVDKPKSVAKVEFNANASFTDVSSKATQVSQQVVEQQSMEILNPGISTEVSQSQKTNAQLHQETISIFRKDFTDAVKDKVMLMISQKLQQFDITLDPPELGNMQVRVNLQNEQAAVSFIVQNQQAKDALEQNMHKLRDMLAEQGVDVGDANVEQQSKENTDENNQDSALLQGENTAQANDAVEHDLSGNAINSAVNGIDYYA